MLSASTEVGREGSALDPERVRGVVRARARSAAPASYARRYRPSWIAGDLVDELARVGVDVDELAHVGAVSDFHLPRQVVRAGDALGQAFAEDEERRARHRELARLPEIGLHLRHRRLARLLGGTTGVGVDEDLGHEGAVHGHELVRGVEVRPQLAGEDRQAAVDLPVGDVGAALAVLRDPDRLSSLLALAMPKMLP